MDNPIETALVQSNSPKIMNDVLKTARSMHLEGYLQVDPQTRVDVIVTSIFLVKG